MQNQKRILGIIVCVLIIGVITWLSAKKPMQQLPGEPLPVQDTTTVGEPVTQTTEVAPQAVQKASVVAQPKVSKQSDSPIIKAALAECSSAPADWHDNCLYEYAAEKNSFEVCSIITNSADKDGCLRTVAVDLKDPKLCEKVPNGNFEKDYCYSGLAWNLKNKALCNMITTNETKLECQQCLTGDREKSLCYPLNTVPGGL